jgi:hypothetical protein
MTTAVDETSGVRLTVPEGWTQLPVEETGALVLAPAHWPEEYGVRPNLSVLVSAPASPAPSVHSAGTVTAAGAAAIDGARVLAYDLWPAPGDRWGRRVVFAYVVDTACLVVTQWVLVEGDRTVTVTGTVDSDRYLRVTPAFGEALAGLQLPPATEAGGAEPVREEVLEPRRDPFLAELGEDLEDLSGFAGQDPWTPVGPEVGRAGLDLLVRAANGRLASRGLDEQEQQALARMTEVDLLDRKGRLTDDGNHVVEVMRRAGHHLRVEATCGMAPFTLDAYSAGDRTVVLATVSPVGWAGQPAAGTDIAAMAQRVWVETMPTATLPLELARWLGLRPAWSLATSPETLPMATLTAKVDDPSTPVPDRADVRLRRAWEQPWFLWSVRVTGGDGAAEPSGAAGVNAGEAGFFSLTRTEHEESALLQAWPSEAVWGRLLALCLA